MSLCTQQQDPFFPLLQGREDIRGPLWLPHHGDTTGVSGAASSLSQGLQALREPVVHITGHSGQTVGGSQCWFMAHRIVWTGFSLRQVFTD